MKQTGQGPSGYQWSLEADWQGDVTGNLFLSVKKCRAKVALIQGQAHSLTNRMGELHNIRRSKRLAVIAGVTIYNWYHRNPECNGDKFSKAICFRPSGLKTHCWNRICKKAHVTWHRYLSKGQITKILYPNCRRLVKIYQLISSESLSLNAATQTNSFQFALLFYFHCTN